MAKTETTKNGFADVAKAFDMTSMTKAFDMTNMTKAFGDMKLPGIDVEAVAASQRKNLEAFTQANQLAVEGAQSLARRQVEIVRQAVDEASQALREWTEAGAPEDRIAKSVELSKQAYEKGIANARELTELATKASTDVFSVIARRFSEGFDELRLYTKKQSSLR
jgi:phasin family protein